jgi:hypothetical protein
MNAPFSTRRAPLLAVVALLSLATACIVEHSSTGELGVAEFAWDEGIFGCLFGCNAKEAVAVGSTATLDVVNELDVPAYDVGSSDPSVIEFSIGLGGIECTAHRAGKAKILLFEQGTTTLIDRFEIRARDVRRVVPVDPDIEDRFTIQVGGSHRLYFNLQDSKRRQLRGIGAASYTLTGGLGTTEVTLTPAESDFLAGILIGTNSEYLDIDALAAGSGTLVVAAGSASRPLSFAVVDGTAVTRVEVSDATDLSVGTSFTMTAEAFAGSDRVFSPACTWTIAPPTGVVTVNEANRDFIHLTADASGTFTATCSIGTANGSRTLTIP